MVIIGLSRTVPPTKPKEEVKYFKSIETSSKGNLTLININLIQLLTNY